MWIGPSPKAGKTGHDFRCERFGGTARRLCGARPTTRKSALARACSDCRNAQTRPVRRWCSKRNWPPCSASPSKPPRFVNADQHGKRHAGRGGAFDQRIRHGGFGRCNGCRRADAADNGTWPAPYSRLSEAPCTARRKPAYKAPASCPRRHGTSLPARSRNRRRRRTSCVIPANTRWNPWLCRSGMPGSVTPATCSSRRRLRRRVRRRHDVAIPPRQCERWARTRLPAAPIPR